MTDGPLFFCGVVMTIRVVVLSGLAIAMGFLTTSCDEGLPNEAQRAAARQALPDLLTGVSRSRRSEDSVVAMRWDIDNIVIEEDEWSWEEVQVIAENGADGAGAETLRYRLSLDPEALGPDVPATLTMQSWGLQLQCAEVACITREGVRINVRDGERSEEPIPARTIARTEWLFDKYEDRDQAVDLAKTALGYRVR